jgi:hypothetical protein
MLNAAAPRAHQAVDMALRQRPLSQTLSYLPAFSHVLVVLFLFVQLSWQQKDPLSDFCRRFGHQQAIIDNKLYLDGGLVNWNPISQNPANYSSKLLLPPPSMLVPIPLIMCNDLC